MKKERHPVAAAVLLIAPLLLAYGLYYLVTGILHPALPSGTLQALRL